LDSGLLIVQTGETASLSEAEYYKLLGIRSDAAQKDVTRAYRKMAAKWHPDK
jgi:DnaJ-class molecular chaperone